MDVLLYMVFATYFTVAIAVTINAAFLSSFETMALLSQLFQ